MKNIILSFTVTICSAMILFTLPVRSNAQSCGCPGAGYLCIPDLTNSSTVTLPGTSTIIYIEGGFVINNSFDLSGYTVWCKDNAGITITTGTLTFSGTTITLDPNCCGTATALWRGITLSSTGTFNCSSSTIELADYGIDCYGGSLSVTSTTFNRNYVGIKLPSSGSYSPTLYGNTFQCYHNSSPSAIECEPYTDVRSHIGIDFSGLTSVTIGGTYPQAFNVFDNLDYGIYCGSSGVGGGGATIQRNQFDNINLSNYPGVLDPSAIYLYNTSSAKTVVIGGTNINYRNEFGTNGTNLIAININGKFNADIKHNAISSIIGACILMTNNNVTTTNIKNNEFLDFDIGVYCYDNHGTNVYNITTLDISGNDFTTGNDGANEGTCIFVTESTSIPNYIDVTINNNGSDSTPINNIYGGVIFAAQLEGAYITYNKMYNVCYDASTSGILLDNCDDASVAENAVNGNNNKAGIQLYYTTTTDCRENWLAYSTDNYLGYGDLSGCNIYCNHFDNADYGVHIQDCPTANFPNRIHGPGLTTYPSDNEWTNITYDGILTTGNGACDLSTKHWYIVQSSCPGTGWSIPPETQTTSVDVFPAVAVPIYQNCNSHTACDTDLYRIDGASAEIEERDELLHDIVFNTGEYAELSDFDQYMKRVFAYKQLLIHPAYLNLGTDDDAAYQQFFDEQQNNNIGYFAHMNDMALEGNIDEANALNVSIAPENDRETYLQQLYNIYNRTLALHNRNFTGEDSSLMFNIAYMDPRSAGDAPIMAQAMLRFFIRLNQEERLTHVNNDLREWLQVYPNPVRNFAQFQINLYQPGNHELTICDLMGKVISSYRLQIPYGHLDVSNFQPGCYLIKLTRNGKLISTSKFIKS